MQKINEITLIVKIVGGCNLNCSYCYSADSTREKSINRMDISTFEKLLFELKNFPVTHSQIILHGGEPLLLGKTNLQKFCDLREDYGVPTANFAMQTNATLIDETWAELLKHNNIGVGVSFDGLDFIQNNQRPFKNGNGSYLAVKKGMENLRKRGFKIKANCVITKNSLNYPNEIYDSLIEHEIYSYDLSPCFDLDPLTLKIYGPEISPEEFGEFMVTIFDRWWRDDNPEIKIRIIDNILQGFLGGTPKLCQFSGSCGSFLSVNYNGDVYPCDLFIGFKDFCLGNIKDNTLTDLYNNDILKKFRLSVKTIRDECKNCEWYPFCKGGCSMHWYLGEKDLTKHNVFCNAQKLLFSHIKDVLTDFIQ